MKIPAAEKSRSYELTYLIPGDKTSVQVTSVETAIKRLAKKHQVSVVSEEDWGKREMAYTIKHGGARQTEAHYKHAVLEADPANVQAFEKDLYLNTDVMRHLLVLAEQPTSDVEEVQEDERGSESEDESEL